MQQNFKQMNNKNKIIKNTVMFMLSSVGIFWNFFLYIFAFVALARSEEGGMEVTRVNKEFQCSNGFNLGGSRSHYM